MNKQILTRKGARKVQDIPKEILKLLNEGKIESVNLVEWLAVDHLILIKNVLPNLGFSSKIIKIFSAEIKSQKKPSAMNSTKLMGWLIYENCSSKKEVQSVFKQLRTHTADSIRCYAPYLIALDSNLSLNEKFKQIKPLVADHHFGVREVVWMAIRPEIDIHLSKAIAFLTNWAEDKNENIRRFTTEATRPRGVWCKHIDALKEKPELLLPILEKLKDDESKYVQDSVGNWLNDASKSRPEFVDSLCEKWKRDTPTKATEKIIKRARRTIDKK